MNCFLERNLSAETIDATNVTCDSRQVELGAIFVAIEGHTANGHDHIPEAMSRGARTVVHHCRFDDSEALQNWARLAPEHVTFIGVPDTRLAAAQLAAKVWPLAPETIAAITGTNGKTSVAWMTAQLWRHFGHRAASLGTVGLHCWGQSLEPLSTQMALMDSNLSGLTTPDAPAFHRTLQCLAENKMTHLACEASSHGLDQRRLDGARITIAAFTNLSRDHLDYHANMAAYLAAKARLFSEVLSENGTAVINIDSTDGCDMADLAESHGHSVIRVGRSDAANIRLISASPHPKGLALAVTYDIEGQSLTASLPTCGLFQAENLGLALGILSASQTLPKDKVGRLITSQIVHTIESLEPVPGRMQPAGQTCRGGLILVDFAHTPDALARSCASARSHLKAGCKLGLVFGAGGDRDAGKREEMGRIARAMTDFAIITDDNPRTENPVAIAAEIAAGHPNAAVIHDRRVAIATGLAALDAGDMLLVAGKGDERTQIVGTESRPFHDLSVIAGLLADLQAK